MKKRYIFLTGIVLTSTLFYLFLSMFSHLQSSIENQIREEFNKEQSLVTERIAIQLSEIFVDDATKNIQFIRQSFALNKLIEAINSRNRRDIDFWKKGAEKVFFAFLNSNTIYHHIKYADKDGNEIIKAARDDIAYFYKEEDDEVSKLENISDAPIFVNSINLNEGQVRILRISNEDHMDMNIGTPIFYKNQKKGAVIIGIEMKEVYSILTPVKHGKTSHTMLFTDKGELLFCSRGLTEGQHKGEINYILEKPSGGYAEIPESHGEKDILLATNSLKVGSERWVVAMESTADEVTGQIKRFEEQKQRLMVMLLLVGIVSLSYFLEAYSDKIKAEIRTDEEIKTSKKLEAINKELKNSKK